MTITTTAPRWQLIRNHVTSRVIRLQSGALSANPGLQSAARADLAELRRASADDPSDPRVWALTLEGLPINLVGTPDSDQPTAAELAVHSALVLFASHAQSMTTERHIRGQRLGLALRALAGDDRANEGVIRRFQAFATATAWRPRIGHLRGLVSLMRSGGVGLDYGAVAADLYRSQTPDGLRRARLQWGRDFYRVSPPTPTADTDTPAEPPNDPASAADSVQTKEN
jgi:CRISPR system Cascade subunit CasB